MMEKHCVSLEIAEKLKKAEWKKETEFWWYCNPQWIKLTEKLKIPISHRGNWFLTTFEHTSKNLMRSAPFATEILEELPKKNIIITKEEKQYRVRYEFDFKKGIRNKVNYRWVDFIDKSLPNILAELWCWIKKEA